jgi:ABC-type Fe3+/spermidine/putrescine transport system ATPase subunit
MRFEIRRLHEKFAITTLYVTHDQAEAMVISDRIAVLDRGRVAQVGTAEDIFQRPRTRFVAEFIGRTNVVDGMAVKPDAIACGSATLRVAGHGLVPGTHVAVSVRPHHIELFDGATPAGANVFRGVVRRASFLGESVDYEIALDGTNLLLRASAPAITRLQPGAGIAVRIDPAACVVLAED